MNLFNKSLTKKTILFLSISTLMMNGCAVKNKFEPIKTLKTKNIWAKKLALNTKKEDCVNCYATPMPRSKAFRRASYKTDKVIDTKHYGAYDYTETSTDRSVKLNNYVRVIPPKSLNSSYLISSDTAIQVGAFRKYAGAKAYMKRYNALSNNYKVTIQTGRKNNKPIHRVRIEGFKNKIEAKKFMYSYGIKDAFLVRK